MSALRDALAELVWDETTNEVNQWSLADAVLGLLRAHRDGTLQALGGVRVEDERWDDISGVHMEVRGCDEGAWLHGDGAETNCASLWAFGDRGEAT